MEEGVEAEGMGFGAGARRPVALPLAAGRRPGGDRGLDRRAAEGRWEDPRGDQGHVANELRIEPQPGPPGEEPVGGVTVGLELGRCTVRIICAARGT